MTTLASDLRNRLERVVVEARDAAEAGARAALEALAIHEPRAYRHMSDENKALRKHLRARAQQLGDKKRDNDSMPIDHLAGECAYEHWHRMLFARFLAENGLLIEPEMGVAMSLAEAEELAKDEGVDVWVFASRCAQRMLPQIFRPDDPLLQVSFATEHMLELERLLASLPAAVFTASDALGWVYQFWQSKKKDEVNRSEVKIGADEISAVTQLFTEPYMVEFLLHNTLGAWWAAKKLTAEDAENAETEDQLRRKVALPGVEWEYLRFVRDEPETAKEAEASDKANPASAIRNPQSHWRPAAGRFDGWPKTAAELRVLDPCCGSGHFLVAALHHLAGIRMAEEGLSPAEAVDAVLRDNLHGLEIDERCCQIAAFALAFAAWTYPNAGGYRSLPDLHIACTGIGPQSTQEQWVKLAEESGVPMPTVGREAIRNGLLNLHRLFSQAPTLGSLINPAELPADLIAADYETIQPYLAAIRSAEEADDETHERAVAAAGMVKAADLLAADYTLVITNVPYLGHTKHDAILRSFCASQYPSGKWDVFSTFTLRCSRWCAVNGTIAIVSPAEWTFLKPFRPFRINILRTYALRLISKLGFGAFSTPIRANPCLSIMDPVRSEGEIRFRTVDTSGEPSIKCKQEALWSRNVGFLNQKEQMKNPDQRVVFGERDGLVGVELLAERATALTGLSAGDSSMFDRLFWEVQIFEDTWDRTQTSVRSTQEFSGRRGIVRWENEAGLMARLAESVRHLNHAAQNWRRGKPAWGKNGVAISLMGDLSVTRYTGEKYDINCCAIVPNDSSILPALWVFAQSGELGRAIRAIDQSLKLAPHTLLKVPFDLAHWQGVAGEEYRDGLPEPESDDPTQWLFHGRPQESTAPLQVAAARLLGYRWPAELDDEMRLSKRARALVKRCDELAKFADDDGIVCIPSVRGEEAAAERLLALLAAAGIKPAKVRELACGADLDDWLRNGFFEEHCKLFHNRPFVWHIWDGRKRDGFHVLVNYHKLCEGDGRGRKLLESLTYSYLGEWITRQEDGVKRGEGGAEDRLAAALELQNRLKAILEGEVPFDVFVRWKPLSQQSIGWEPDINDGVRLNIRPFLASDLPNGRKGAGILRYKPNIKWKKDRGKEPQRPKAEYPWFWNWDETTEDFIGGKEPDGNRWNACHYTAKAKQAARDAAKDD